MGYHILFTFFITLGYFVFRENKLHPNAHKNYIIYVCTIFVLQSALRNLAIGSDTYAYYINFENVATRSWSELIQNFHTVYILGEGKDAGYPLLIKIFQILFNDFRIFLFALAIFFFYVWGTLVKRITTNNLQVLLASSLYLFLFYSFFSITGIRQTISVALSICAFLFIKDKKYICFAIVAIMAFFIHKSSVIIILYPIIYHWRKLKFLIAFSIAGFIIFAIYRNTLVNISRTMAGYEDYNAPFPISLMLFYIVMTIFVFVYAFRNNNNPQSMPLINMYTPTFMWVPLLGNDSLFMREVLFFSIYCTVLIPLALDNKKYRKILISLIIFSLFYYCYISPEYGFLWENIKLGENYGNV